MPISLQALRANAEIVERLAWSFDFRIGIQPDEPAWFSVDGIKAFAQVGRDSTGGAFVVLPDSRVLYVDSEGSAGTIAADFDAFIELIVACPHWQGVLKFSSNGNLDEMRRAAKVLEARAMFSDEDEVDEAREFLRTQLGLAEPVDPVGALHHAVSTSDVVVRTNYGEPFTTLVGRLTVEDSPLLRGFTD